MDEFICQECGLPVCEHTIEHIRQMENVIVVAKQAITSLEKMERVRQRESVRLNQRIKSLEKKLDDSKISEAKNKVDRGVNKDALFKAAYAK